MLRKALFMITFAIIGTLSDAHANVTYTYTGKDFTAVGSPYTTSDSIDITLTYATALSPNLNNQSETPLLFTISDGIQSYDQSSGVPSEKIFKFSTDNSGDITQWFVDVDDNGSLVISTQSNGVTAIDVGLLTISGGHSAENVNDPGTWANPASSVSTPEPSTFALSAAALVMLGCLRFRRS